MPRASPRASFIDAPPQLIQRELWLPQICCSEPLTLTQLQREQQLRRRLAKWSPPAAPASALSPACSVRARCSREPSPIPIDCIELVGDERERATMLARYTDNQGRPLRQCELCDRHADWLKANRPNVHDLSSDPDA